MERVVAELEAARSGGAAVDVEALREELRAAKAASDDLVATLEGAEEEKCQAEAQMTRAQAEAASLREKLLLASQLARDAEATKEGAVRDALQRREGEAEEEQRAAVESAVARALEEAGARLQERDAGVAAAEMRAAAAEAALSEARSAPAGDPFLTSAKARIASAVDARRRWGLREAELVLRIETLDELFRRTETDEIAAWLPTSASQFRSLLQQVGQEASQTYRDWRPTYGTKFCD
ncbi:hypothetical protein EMIHUDRAFT_450754 [Emiliania huxleyi CCMP1516]|uniref:Uncharacterized protein n=2 Tax=Emiliania huxleyi TaxID=2903 RepID=A0A0D3JFK8_EMIH1|nr:hypothetical protein EMIHUDRAFT_450754 [Emiliania huxleyi CCMP1516]EOD22293.1 hypothetical protein EMIHUDRAFT_450754 [Emiliania huxleyi CCMP1516]|eukprot:XP_005774722.1 hypothetical protein EMIHUDRAFT_450754 [Emiliania huxleyi CCMP1516]